MFRFNRLPLREYIVTLLIVVTVNFLLPRVMPGDPFTAAAASEGYAVGNFSAEQIAGYKAYYGLDLPLWQQYLAYLAKLVQGDLGYSLYYKESVTTMIAARFPWTAVLVLAALFVSSTLGIWLGCLSAWCRAKSFDKILYFSMLVLAEIPSFLTGILLLFLFAAKLGWFPLAGATSPFARFDSAFLQGLDIVLHAVLPVSTLALAGIGEFYLLARSSMLTILTKDYMRTARAKGLATTRLIFRHALKNALPPIIARFFLSLGTLFGGAILIETVFDYPGLGRLMREAVLTRDYILLQGIFLWITVTVLTANHLADILCKKLDPRVM